tara:strand:- start:250 stop:384 length:135 start_codon:yes stop_codon:yes gene_type:complete
MSEDSDSNIEWDIEELKKAYIRGAEEYDKVVEALKDDENVGIST